MQTIKLLLVISLLYLWLDGRLYAASLQTASSVSSVVQSQQAENQYKTIVLLSVFFIITACILMHKIAGKIAIDGTPHFMRQLFLNIRDNPFDFIVVCLVLLWIYINSIIPLDFKWDDWYHLSVIRAFCEKGFTTHDWWGYQPVGRPHLYPPLMHLLSAWIMKIGSLNLFRFGKLYKIIVGPLCLLSVWLGIRLLLGARVAFWSVILISLTPDICEAGRLFLPGLLILCSIPLLIYCVLKNKKVAAIILLTAGLYTHTGMPMVVLILLVLMGWWLPDTRKTVSITIIISLMLFLPWLVWVARNVHSIHSNSDPFHVCIQLAWLLAVMGLVHIILKGKREERVWIYFLVALCVFLPSYIGRFWSNISIPLSVIGAIWLVKLRGKLSYILKILVLAAAIIGQPFWFGGQCSFASLVLNKPLHGVCFVPSTARLLFSYAGTREDHLTGQPLNDKRIEWIKNNTTPDDIIITDDVFFAGMVFSITGRRTTSGGWTEVCTPGMQAAIKEFIKNGGGVRVPF
jgi:hypothetical protein